MMQILSLNQKIIYSIRNLRLIVTNNKTVVCMKNIKTILIIIASVWLLVKCIGGDNEDTSSTNNQTADYSWIYGTWQLSINGETQLISFSENGLYTDTYRTNFGSGSTMGNFTIESEKNRIRLNESGDDYPSYIEIDGKRLKSNGEYYRKK